jgi:hypothetical protein
VKTQGREALATLVSQRDVTSLQQQAGLSKLDALALLQQSADKGFDAAFDLSKSTAVFGGAANTTSAGQQAVSLAAGQRGAPALSPMFAVKAPKTEPRDVAAHAAALTKDIVARFDLDLFLPNASITAIQTTLADFLAKDKGQSSVSDRTALAERLLANAFIAADDPGLEDLSWSKAAASKLMAFSAGAEDWTKRS